ncbi:MAG: flavodoxin family protein [Methanobacteriota archaeon]|nr:MAG: flavodoxin family protein [Euryarchaeota archaeon]
MLVLVTYFSSTGNTKLLAESVAKGVEKEGVECVLKPVQQVTEEDFLSANGIIAGSPSYFGSMAAEMKNLFDRMVGLRRRMEGKVGAAFSTSGDPSGGKETTMLSIIQAMMIYGMIIVGDPMEAGGHYGVSCQGRPGKEDLEKAEALGRRVAKLVKKLYG